MRQLISLGFMAFMAIGLSSCAELSSLKRSVFGEKDSASKTLHNVDSRSLRQAPNQQFVFDGTKDYDVVIYDTALTGRVIHTGEVHYYYSDHYYEMERRLNAS